jgi:hypothetical protein
MNSDQVWYTKLIKKLENDHLLGNDNWPTDINSAYTLLNNWKGSTQFKSPGASDGVAFTIVDGGCGE